MIIDGKIISKKINEELKQEIKKIFDKINIYPGLAIIKIGDDKASEIYIRNKIAKCKELGINSFLYEYNYDVSTKEVLNLIDKLNDDENVHGIIVQLPIPYHLNKTEIIEKINPKKDVDAFTYFNFGRVALGSQIIMPCTSAGIMHLIKETKIQLEGASCVVVGRSQIVGKPTAYALINESATVTVCHSKTKDLKSILLSADIIVCAVGKINLITGDMIKKGSVIIDVGINRIENKIYGDVNFEEAVKKAGFITPVPGGVGPMTIAYLIKNLVTLFKNQLKI